MLALLIMFLSTSSHLAPVKQQCVVFGDSLSTPAPLSQIGWSVAFASLSNGVKLTISNFAVSGSTVETMNANFQRDVARLIPAVTGLPLFVSVWSGNNSIGQSESAATIYAALQTTWSSVKALNAFCVAWTITPTKFWPLGSDQDNVRLALNTLIRSDATKYDALNDFGDSYTIDQMTNPTPPNTITVDGTHFTTLAYFGQAVGFNNCVNGFV